MKFLEWYAGLPRYEDIPTSLFYVRGYTEAVAYYSGVRVFPSMEWFSDVPFEMQKMVQYVGAPCYVLPAFMGNACYALYLKGYQKAVPHYGADYPCGIDRVTEGSTIIMVEGIKDTAPLFMVAKSLGIVPLPMLTALPGEALLSYLVSRHCRIVFVPDNDAGRVQHIHDFCEMMRRLGGQFCVFSLECVKDFGDFYDHDNGREFVLQNLRWLSNTIKDGSLW